MSLSSAPVVGVPDPTHWPQVFSRGSVEFGSVFVAFTIRDGAGTRAQGKAFLEHASELAYDDPAQFSEKLKALCEDDRWMVDSLAAAIFRDGKAYVWSWHGGRVALKRGIKQGIVVDDPQWKVVMGTLQKGDVFVLGTPAFFTAVPMVMDVPGETAEDRADRAALALQKAEDIHGAAAYIVQCESVEQRVVTPQHIQQVVTQKEEVSESEAQKESSLIHFASSFGGVVRILGMSYGPVIQSVFRGKGIQLQTHVNKRKRVIGVVLLVFFILFGGIMWVRYTMAQEEKRVQALLLPYSQQIDHARSIQNTDITSARKETREVIQALKSKIESEKPKSKEAKQLQSLLDDVEQYYTTISGEKSLNSAPVFYNFQLVKSAFLAKRASVEGDFAVFVDPEGSGIMLNLKNKQPSVMDFGGVTRIRDVVLKDQKTYVLGSKEGDDISIFSGGKSVGPTLSSSDDPLLLRVFGSSAYVWMKNSGELLKLPGQGTNFSDGKNWLRTVSGLDKSTVTSIAIDGKVWLGTSNGMIFSLAQGSKQSFTVTGMSQPFTSSLMIHTTPDHTRLYVLEPSTKRLVVLDKSGAFQLQVSAPELSAATDMFVDVSGKTAYIAAGSVVYAVELE